MKQAGEYHKADNLIKNATIVMESLTKWLEAFRTPKFLQISICTQWDINWLNFGHCIKLTMDSTALEKSTKSEFLLAKNKPSSHCVGVSSPYTSWSHRLAIQVAKTGTN